VLRTKKLEETKVIEPNLDENPRKSVINIGTRRLISNNWGPGPESLDRAKGGVLKILHISSKIPDLMIQSANAQQAASSCTCSKRPMPDHLTATSQLSALWKRACDLYAR
jgi:hypothetical protein